MRHSYRLLPNSPHDNVTISAQTSRQVHSDQPVRVRGCVNAEAMAPVVHDQTRDSHLHATCGPRISCYILLTCGGGTSGSASAFSLPASVIWQLKGQLCTDGVLTMQVRD